MSAGARQSDSLARWIAAAGDQAAWRYIGCASTDPASPWWRVSYKGPRSFSMYGAAFLCSTGRLSKQQPVIAIGRCRSASGNCSNDQRRYGAGQSGCGEAGTVWGMNDASSPEDLTYERDKLRRGMRAALAVLKRAQAEFAAEMALLNAASARRAQESRERLSSRNLKTPGNPDQAAIPPETERCTTAV